MQHSPKQEAEAEECSSPFTHPTHHIPTPTHPEIKAQALRFHASYELYEVLSEYMGNKKHGKYY